MRTSTGLFLLGAALVAQTAFADCGSIPFKSWVSVFEPNQRAVIAWDGKEQILLLSTDLSASEPTKVLEVIPFPAEPEVKQGDALVFRKATDLINRKLFPKRLKGFGGGGGMGGGAAVDAPPPPAGEVVFHEKIGAHDISVIHVLHQQGFIQWVQAYLAEAGVDNPAIPETLKSVVKEYLRDGFPYFAFNVVDLGPETVTKEAVQYRFKTRFLYYPLKITRVEKGDTTVRLLILSPQLVRLPGSRFVRVRLVHQPVSVTENELRDLDEDLHDLLGGRSQLLLRTWEIKGKLSSFRHDVITR